MTFTVFGKRWRLRFPRIYNNDGECDHPNMPGKEIRVAARLKGHEFLTTLIHEFDHVADWSKDEEWISEHSEKLADLILRREILERIGLRWKE